MISPEQFGPLFHGTDQDFSVGDIIEPRTKKHAHATPSLKTARGFGKKVYEVEPIDPEETFTSRMKYTGREYHQETLGPGFRVVGKPIPKSRKKDFYSKRGGDPAFHDIEQGWTHGDNGWEYRRQPQWWEKDTVVEDKAYDQTPNASRGRSFS